MDSDTLFSNPDRYLPLNTIIAHNGDEYVRWQEYADLEDGGLLYTDEDGEPVDVPDNETLNGYYWDYMTQVAETGEDPLNECVVSKTQVRTFQLRFLQTDMGVVFMGYRPYNRGGFKSNAPAEIMTFANAERRPDRLYPVVDGFNTLDELVEKAQNVKRWQKRQYISQVAVADIEIPRPEEDVRKDIQKIARQTIRRYGP